MIATLYFMVNGQPAEAIVPLSKIFQMNRELKLLQAELNHIFTEDEFIKGSILN